MKDIRYGRSKAATRICSSCMLVGCVCVCVYVYSTFIVFPRFERKKKMLKQSRRQSVCGGGGDLEISPMVLLLLVCVWLGPPVPLFLFIPYLAIRFVNACTY